MLADAMGALFQVQIRAQEVACWAWLAITHVYSRAVFEGRFPFGRQHLIVWSAGRWKADAVWETSAALASMGPDYLSMAH
jgi:hypothetical protein